MRLAPNPAGPGTLTPVETFSIFRRVSFKRIESLEDVARGIRSRLELVFSPDTAVPGTTSSEPSAGHCGAVALVVQAALGGDVLSTIYRGESHWFNRFITQGGVVDVDLTGDQFGLAPVRIAQAGALFPDTRVRRIADARNETLERARALATRAGLSEVARAIGAELDRRAGSARPTA